MVVKDVLSEQVVAGWLLISQRVHFFRRRYALYG